MKSITKNHLSREKIIQLITHCFKDCFEVGEIIELKGGFFNSAYLIERLNFHDKIVLKVSVEPDNNYYLMSILLWKQKSKYTS